VTLQQIQFLHRSYPLIFSQQIGVDCPSGWFDLIDRVCAQLEQFAKAQQACGVSIGSLPQLRDIKEKHGLLCIYFSGDDPRIDTLLLEAEEESKRLCAICGKQATTRRGFNRLCEVHGAARL
jgi:hypothetical protein